MLPFPNPGDIASSSEGFRHLGPPDAGGNQDVTLDLGELTQAMAAGDESAFSVFYDHYYDRLFRYLIVLTQGDEPRTRDLLQVTLMKVLRAIKPFTEERQLWQWLKTVARNTFLDSIRQSRRVPDLIPLSDFEPELCSAPSEGNDERPLFEALDACLVELPASERDLVEACYVRNLSQHEAAVQRNTTAKAVESKLARVRQKLRLAILRRLRHET
jgi:RNA polymerase sigma factor (sigma-70 family)